MRVRKDDRFPTECQSSPSEAEISYSYSVASDCRLCGEGGCQSNPAPTWLGVPFAFGQSEAVVDLSPSRGAQLCWKATVRSPNFSCQPEIFNVDVGYEVSLVP
ncbi:hypothetical protein HUA76_35530 [Myxococcus sp. CA056]|uniref:hypothetical protein n=1 Tax=Myxococcus sp. CA056 TaxID=2741740 RepID=UPI00157B7FC2|nr:hypothetical protein [Myxococcus sp. CA056]NTX16095.1 hypothetical protein [Myxococcus sp. CA056]